MTHTLLQITAVIKGAVRRALGFSCLDWRFGA